MTYTATRTTGQTVEYLSLGDTSRALRRALKAAFPGVTFRVRSSSFAGGSAIDVRWTDGPTYDKVNALARTFAGSAFDGSIDMAVTVYAYVDDDLNVLGYQSAGTVGSRGVLPAVDDAVPGARLVRFGAGYVHVDRDTSPATDALVDAALRRYYGDVPASSLPWRARSDALAALGDLPPADPR